MTKRITAVALVFTLITAFIPMPAKAQVGPPIPSIDLDPLGRLTRISFVNPRTAVRETLTLAYGDTFEAQTFSTSDGVLLFTMTDFTPGKKTVSTLKTNGNKLSVEVALLEEADIDGDVSGEDTALQITASISRLATADVSGITRTTALSAPADSDRIFADLKQVTDASVEAGLNRELSRFCGFVGQASALTTKLPETAMLHAGLANFGVPQADLCEPDGVSPASCKQICDGLGLGRVCRIVCRIIKIAVAIISK